MALKVAVVGMGGIGNTHARCYKENPLAELVAVCDLVKEKADKAAEEFGCRAFYDEEEMLKAMPEIDIVSVTTSGYDNGSMHFEPAMLALSYGKNVLVEKPICADIYDARELVRYAAKQKVYLGCDLNHYFSGPAFAADELMKNGGVGELVYCIHKVGFNGSELKYGGPGAPRWQTPYSHLKASARIRSASCATSAATSWACRRSCPSPACARPRATRCCPSTLFMCASPTAAWAT